MEQWEKDLYNKLTNEHDESGETARLNRLVFGEEHGDWYGVDRARKLESMRARMEADSYQGGA